MTVKSYYSASVEAAIAQARQELGPEAMLLNSRRAMPETRHLGDYEVAFAVAHAEPRTSNEANSMPDRSPADPTVDRLSREVSELRRQMERTAAMFQRASTIASGPVATNAEYLQMFASLAANDVDAELAHRIISAARVAAEASPGVLLVDAVRNEILQLVCTGSDLGTTTPGPKVVAFVGPPGAGKTTTLVKVAVRYGLARHQRVQLLSLDTDRVGGADQLRSFAAVLGVGFDLVPPAALDHVLGRYEHRDLILIDTPGFDLRHSDLFAQLSRAVAGNPHVDTHLVIAASMKAADVERTCQVYEGFYPGKLLFTRLDETRTYGALLNQAVARRLPISFLCAGQSIPEDIETAGPERLAGLLLGADTPRSAVVAA